MCIAGAMLPFIYAVAIHLRVIRPFYTVRFCMVHGTVHTHTHTRIEAERRVRERESLRNDAMFLFIYFMEKVLLGRAHRVGIIGIPTEV